jgi:hypothetical protein
MLTTAVIGEMGLRYGRELNELCPGLNGPSDIDHVLHNMHVRPERVCFIEYKRNGRPLPQGQQYLARALQGEWREPTSGRALSITYVRLDQTPGVDTEDALHRIVEWVWPGLGEATA